jgi:hypothetical protein
MHQQGRRQATSFTFRRLNYVKGEQNELDDYHYKIGDCRCPAQSLSGLVTYQEGSVVIRVVLKREKGNVTLFAFDKGQELSEHTSPFDALVQAIESLCSRVSCALLS